MEGILFSGRMSDIDFLERLYPLQEMGSNDSRCKNAYADIWQHTVNNNDLDGNWAFQDSRFGLLDGEDAVFFKFVCEMAHPLVRIDAIEAARIIAIANDWLKSESWELYTK